MPTLSREKRRGNSIIEFSLFLPWFIFLFVGIYDFGFYGYSLTAAITGVSAAARYCSFNATNQTACSTSTSAPCTYALNSLKDLPNVGSGMTTCAASPVVLSTSTGTDSSGNSYIVVNLRYTTPQLIPIPGMLPGQITITKAVTLPIQETI